MQGSRGLLTVWLEQVQLPAALHSYMTLRVGDAEHRTEVSDVQQRPQYKQSYHSFDFDLDHLEGMSAFRRNRRVS